jgi:uncharacterized membrane protein YciS (DUF1049 family)
MWIIRWIFVTILLLAAVAFMGQNQQDKVFVHFFTWVSPEIEVSYLLFIAFGSGVLVHLLFSVLKQFQLQAEMSRLKRQIRKLHSELEQLRNLAIEEELFPQNLVDVPPSGTFPNSHTGTPPQL